MPREPSEFRCIVDPKQRNFFAYAGATVLKPNLRELDAAFGTAFMGDDSDLEAARVKLGVDHLVLTRGADGVALISAGKPVRETPAISRAVFDVSGAGDTVAAWLTTALAAGADIAEAAWLANLAASVKVAKRGTATGPRTKCSPLGRMQLGIIDLSTCDPFHIPPILRKNGARTPNNKATAVR